MQSDATIDEQTLYATMMRRIRPFLFTCRVGVIG